MKAMVTMTNDEEMTFADADADADDEPDSPVFILHIPDRFEAELIVSDQRWLDLVGPRQREAVTKAIDACFDLAPDSLGTTLSILLADDAVLAELNHTHRGSREPTNVLSFPDDDEDAVGDIAIGYETVMAEAANQNKAPGEHLLHLVIHGVLHLLGYDHHDDDEAETMEQLEVEILAELGTANPYQETR